MKRIITLIFSCSFFIVSSQTVIVSEDFSSGISWYNSNYGQCLMGWAPLSTTNYPQFTPFNFSGDFAYAYSWDNSTGACQAGTYMMSPYVDASSYTSATLTFDHYFSPFGVDTAEVWCYSSGGNWNLLQRFTSTNDSGNVSISLNNYLSDSLAIIFDYRGYDGYFWAIDNIKVEAMGGAVTPSWDCVNGACIDPGNSSGGYNDSLLCVANCIAASWDCVNGVCTDPSNGTGTYNDSLVCVASCFQASWDCNNTTGVCFNPGTGQGQYPTLVDCQNVCIAAASWNCISPGNCQDPGDGSGMFPTLAACQSSCVPTISMDNDVPVNFMIFTDRTGLEVPNGNASGISISITPHSSNPRNYLNPGRTVRFKVGVTNNLGTNLTSALITLTPSITDPFVTIITNQVGLNNITSTATEFTLNEFEIVIDNSCPQGHIFYADFEIEEQITQTKYYSTAYPIIIEPFVNTSTTFIDDDSNPDSNGNDDHIVDPNETIEITPMLAEVLPNTINTTDFNGSSSGSPGSNGFAFPGSEDELVGCLLNINNYNFINIWDNVAGATGANVVDCLPDPGIFNSEWFVQSIQSVDYIRPGFDYVFDFNASSTCKFNLYVEFEAAMTWNHIGLDRWNDRIRWLSKIEINTNEPPCVPTNNLSYTINSNKIFPNPFKERAFLELQDDVTHNILLFDVMGKLLREYKDINNDKLIIERGSLSSGTYLLKIINDNVIRMEKLIIE